ncbi:hypothetical protein SLEP1_g36129 [Rubroshorea leprosula]|uniref:Uncharacterized protein n=1 Tax=Rubroshorea leprosula TaxID=152421 RepID=A0AAV5KQX6_9ROSI|nr:hypothetical protein SLEP1_g36129 [Rubroshorea leprosula]
MRGVYEEQCNALGMGREPFSPYSETYNPSRRNHPNFSWKANQNHPTSSNSTWNSEAQPPRSYPTPQYNARPNRNPSEETLKAFMEAQTKTNQKFDSILTQVVEENKDIKSQLTKLTNALTIQERGKIPSQPQANPKNLHLVQESTSNSENIQGVNAITTRTGKVIEPLQKSPKLKDATPSSREDDLLEEPEKEVPIRVPFPQALQTGKISNNQGEILENLKEVKINLPLLHVIKQVPTYAKVIKDLCTIKRKHHVKKTAFLTEHVSAVIEQKTPPKYKDPGCPTIACQIGSQEFGQALLDLGASVNLMPYLVYLQLGLGEIKPTSVVLQLADRSCRKPRGIVEDVLLQIDKFYYPVDFLVLDTQSEVNSESKIPLILERPFLATANALINCRNGLMKLSFGNMTFEVNIFHVGKQLYDDDECYQTYMIDSLVEEVYERENSKSLEYLIGDSDLDDDFLNDHSNVSSISNARQDKRRKFLEPGFEELLHDRKHLKPFSMEMPPCEGLKHAFLGESSKLLDNG